MCLLSFAAQFFPAIQKENGVRGGSSPGFRCITGNVLSTVREVVQLCTDMLTVMTLIQR